VSTDIRAPALSIVLPAHNEEDNVEPLLDELARELGAVADSAEILLVDDGSTDETARRALAWRDRRPDVALRVLHRERREGKSAGALSGIDAARGQRIVVMDADLQSDPADIRFLLAALARADAAVGVRHARKDSLLRRVGSRLANAVRRGILRDGAHDGGSSLWAIRSDMARRIVRFNGMHRFITALVLREGGLVEEVPIRHRPRIHGRAKYGLFNRLAAPVLDLAGLRWLSRRRICGNWEEL
jgi:glycosyltransferase involved in cell wall biosynthesis